MLIGSIGAAPLSVIFELLWIKDSHQPVSVADKERAACGGSADRTEHNSSRIMRLSGTYFVRERRQDAIGRIAPAKIRRRKAAAGLGAFFRMATYGKPN